MTGKRSTPGHRSTPRPEPPSLVAALRSGAETRTDVHGLVAVSPELLQHAADEIERDDYKAKWEAAERLATSLTDDIVVLMGERDEARAQLREADAFQEMAEATLAELRAERDHALDLATRAARLLPVELPVVEADESDEALTRLAAYLDERTVEGA